MENKSLRKIIPLVRPAKMDDLSSMHSLLSQANLPTEGVESSVLQNYFVAYLDGQVVGMVGIEIYGAIGLLRSLVVAPAYRNKGIARRLLSYIIGCVRENSVQTLYLLTTTATNYFQDFGFKKIERSQTPAAIKNTLEFSQLCPEYSEIMAFNIS